MLLTKAFLIAGKILLIFFVSLEMFSLFTKTGVSQATKKLCNEGITGMHGITNHTGEIIGTAHTVREREERERDERDERLERSFIMCTISFLYRS